MQLLAAQASHVTKEYRAASQKNPCHDNWEAEYLLCIAAAATSNISSLYGSIDKKCVATATINCSTIRYKINPLGNHAMNFMKTVPPVQKQF
jgi:hypothetical protein